MQVRFRETDSYAWARCGAGGGLFRFSLTKQLCGPASPRTANTKSVAIAKRRVRLPIVSESRLVNCAMKTKGTDAGSLPCFVQLLDPPTLRRALRFSKPWHVSSTLNNPLQEK